MAVKVRALGNKNFMVQWLPETPVVGAERKILEGLDRWKMHSRAYSLPPYISANMVGIKSFF